MWREPLAPLAWESLFEQESTCCPLSFLRLQVSRKRADSCSQLPSPCLMLRTVHTTIGSGGCTARAVVQHLTPTMVPASLQDPLKLSCFLLIMG